MALVDKNYQAAYKLFSEASRVDLNNPDILNMLAFSQRKLGRVDEAIRNYKKALGLRPRFPEAREYLAEAYIQAALKEAQTLNGYGADGDEELKKLIQKFKNATQTLEAPYAPGQLRIKSTDW